MKSLQTSWKHSDVMVMTGPHLLLFINPFGHLGAPTRSLGQRRLIRFIKISGIGLRSMLVKK